MYQAIDYYRPLSKSQAEHHDRGQFWWTCFPYAANRPIVTRFWPDRRVCEPLNLNDFDPTCEQPNKNAHTEAGEFWAIAKYKRRPVVILSTGGSVYKDRGWEGGEFVLVAPARSLRDPLSGEYKAPPEFVWGAITYEYTPLFYLPSDAGYGMHEAVVHFDRIMALHRSWLMEPRSACLTSDAMVCLDEWLRSYTYGKVRARFHQDLEDYRQMVGGDPQVRAAVYGTRVA